MVTPASPGPLETLDRMRAAAIARSAADMSQVYAAGAVHEFPFTRPGAPARLEGRDTIMGFIAAFWDTSLPDVHVRESIEFRSVAFFE